MSLYGATQLLDLTPPNGAIHLRPGIGLAPASPGQTWIDAMALVPDQGTIVVHGGRWPVSLTPPRQKRFTIQPGPGTRWTLDGADIVRAWAREGDEWYTPFTPSDHTPNSWNIVSSDNPLAAWPERVWIDGQRARMVAAGAGPLEPGEFAVDTATNRIYIADDPALHEIKVATRQQAFRGSQDGNPAYTILGADIVGYAPTSMQRAAVSLFGPFSRMAHCRWTDCAAASVSARASSIVIERCDMVRAGQLGVHGYQAHNLKVTGCHIIEANYDLYSRIAEAGGSKVSSSVGVWWDGNLVEGSYGHDLWADEGSHAPAWTNNKLIGRGIAAGVMCELSDGGQAYNNWAEGHEIDILGANTARFQVRHCTVSNQILFRMDDRRTAEQQLDNIAAGNISHGVQQAPVPPTSWEAELCGLPSTRSGVDQAGWYGPPNPNQENPPMTIQDQIDLCNTAEAELDAAAENLDRARTSVETAVTGLAQAALALETEAGQLAIETAAAILARDQAVAARDQALAQAAAATAQLAGRTTERDTALDRTVALGALVWKVPLGSSNQAGYPDVKARIEQNAPAGRPVRLNSFTQFCTGVRFTTADLDKMGEYIADGVNPSVSVQLGDNNDTIYNCQQLTAQGFHLVPGRYTIASEPTVPSKNINPAIWGLVHAAARTYLPAAWLNVPVFQRADFLYPTSDARHISKWLGSGDLAWCNEIGVNVYDKNQSAGNSFQDLVTTPDIAGQLSVEGYAASKGKRLFIRETGCPQDGDWNRPAGYQVAWHAAQVAYLEAHPDRYAGANKFHSTVGGTPPPNGWVAPAAQLAGQLLERKHLLH